MKADKQQKFNCPVPEKLGEQLKALAVDGRISCQDARKLAEEEGLEYGFVGYAIDMLKLRIVGCGLGCF